MGVKRSYSDPQWQHRHVDAQAAVKHLEVEPPGKCHHCHHGATMKPAVTCFGTRKKWMREIAIKPCRIHVLPAIPCVILNYFVN